jgi:hypothetical protein
VLDGISRFSGVLLTTLHVRIEGSCWSEGAVATNHKVRSAIPGPPKRERDNFPKRDVTLCLLTVTHEGI